MHDVRDGSVLHGGPVKRVTETDLVGAIIHALKAMGVWAWRQNSGSVKLGGRMFHGAPK